MKATRLHPQSEDAFGHEIIVWSWERQLPNAAQTLKVLICYGHTRSLGDCVPEHRVETDSLPETRNQITNTGLSFSRLRTHCTIAPLTKKRGTSANCPLRSRQLRVPSVWRCSQWHVILKSSQVTLVHNPLVFQCFSNGNILCSGYP